MGKINKDKKVKMYRKMIQVSFLIFTVFFLVKFVPSREFALTVLVLLLLVTILFRTGFCGWVCPSGTIVDFLRWLGKKIGGLSFIKPVNRNYKKWIKNNKGLLAKIDKYARYFRFVFLLWIIQSAFLSVVSIKNEDEHGIISVLYLVIALLVLGLFVDRAWCKYACPLGAILGIIGKFSPTRVTRYEKACISCNICSKTCPMNIDVAKQKYVKLIDCNTCLSCVDACPVEAALDLQMNIPFHAKEPQPIEMIKKQVMK